MQFSFWLTNAGLKRLRRLSTLTSLNLGHCNDLTGHSMKYLRRLPLNHLDLSWCDWLMPSGLRRLRRLPLSSLVLAGCRGLDGACVKTLKRMQLNSLDLCYALWLTNVALYKLRRLPLTSLKLSRTWNVPRLDDTCLRHLQAMPLTSLELSQCQWVMDSSLTVNIQHTLAGSPAFSLCIHCTSRVQCLYGVGGSRASYFTQLWNESLQSQGLEQTRSFYVCICAEMHITGPEAVCKMLEPSI